MDRPRPHPYHPARVGDLTADELRRLLGLEPHPTCGFVAETYRSETRIASGGLPAPFSDGRPLGSALCFLVTPDAPVHLHRIRNDQLYHRYLGDALDVLLLYPDGTSDRVQVGPELHRAQRLELFIPGGTFHTARLADGGRWFLGASTEWPGVEPQDVELGDRDALARRYPDRAAELHAFTRDVQPGDARH